MSSDCIECLLNGELESWLITCSFTRTLSDLRTVPEASSCATAAKAAVGGLHAAVQVEQRAGWLGLVWRSAEIAAICAIEWRSLEIAVRCGDGS